MEKKKFDKVAYNNDKGWSNVNVYAWNTAGGELAKWPGQLQMFTHLYIKIA